MLGFDSALKWRKKYRVKCYGPLISQWTKNVKNYNGPKIILMLTCLKTHVISNWVKVGLPHQKSHVSYAAM
jgi:hypothetical protein